MMMMTMVGRQQRGRSGRAGKRGIITSSTTPAAATTLQMLMLTTTTLLLLTTMMHVDLVHGQVNVEFCGVEKECRIPINDESCKQLSIRYNFFGSCCHLQDIPGTGGCRIVVTASGNCGWTPKCSNTKCKESTKCNIEFQTKNTEECGSDRYNVLSQVQEPPKPCPTEAPLAASTTDAPATSTATRTMTTMTMTTILFLSCHLLLS